MECEREWAREVKSEHVCVVHPYKMILMGSESGRISIYQWGTTPTATSLRQGLVHPTEWFPSIRAPLRYMDYHQRHVRILYGTTITLFQIHASSTGWRSQQVASTLLGDAAHPWTLPRLSIQGEMGLLWNDALGSPPFLSLLSISHSKDSSSSSSSSTHLLPEKTFLPIASSSHSLTHTPQINNKKKKKRDGRLVLALHPLEKVSYPPSLQDGHVIDAVWLGSHPRSHDSTTKNTKEGKEEVEEEEEEEEDNDNDNDNNDYKIVEEEEEDDYEWRKKKEKLLVWFFSTLRRSYTRDVVH